VKKNSDEQETKNEKKKLRTKRNHKETAFGSDSYIVASFLQFVDRGEKKRARLASEEQKKVMITKRANLDFEKN